MKINAFFRTFASRLPLMNHMRVLKIKTFQNYTQSFPFQTHINDILIIEFCSKNRNNDMLECYHTTMHNLLCLFIINYSKSVETLPYLSNDLVTAL